MRWASVTTRGMAIVLLALASAGGTAHGDDAGALELAVKSTYLYKFQPFVTWPDQAFPSPTSPFNLCIVGDDPFGAVIDRAIAGQSAGPHAMAVVRLRTAAPDVHCQIMYVGTHDPQTALQSLAAVRGMPVLTVTDSTHDAAAKGIINFVIVENRVRFEIDTEAAMRNGLSISSKLLSLALSVGPVP